MPAPFWFELDKNEQAQTKSLADELSEAIKHGLDFKHDNDTLADFRNRFSAIAYKARERNLKYYASHHDELITALQGEIRNIVYFAVIIEKEEIQSDFAYKFAELAPYTELLNQTEREEILDYMRYAYEHREQLFKEEEAEDTQTYESQITKKVKNIIAPVDKVTQSIFNPLKNPAFYNEGADLVVGKKKEKEVTTAVFLRFEELGKVKTSNKLDENHRAIYNAVISQILAGNTLFTDSMIARTITGKEKVEEKTRLTIKKGMDTLIRTRASVDATQEAKAFNNLNEIKNLKYEGALLDVRRITAIINGQIIECYKIVAEPWLLTYAKSKKQINTYDVSFLNAPFNSISVTHENISLVSHLLNRIMTMRNPKSKLGGIVLYETLYQLAEIKAPTETTLRAKRRRLRDTIHKILDVWKKEGLINCYEDLDEEGKPVTKGRKTAKIKISCSSKKIKLQ